MRRDAVLGVVVAGLIVVLTAGCGSSTPDTEGQTLAQARQSLSDAGVPDRNITVTGETGGDPGALVVCDHDPDGVAPSEPVTLEVAQVSPDDSSKKRKKNSSGGGRRR